MFSALPLDDLIGRTFYIDGASWRYVYNKALARFALRRTADTIDFNQAIELIASGEMLWTPPEQFDPLRPDVSVDAVQKHIALLDAFRRSPSCADARDWTLPSRVDARLSESRAWLTRRAPMSGEKSDEAAS